MTKKLRIAIAQLALRAGDIEGNLKKHLEAAKCAYETHQVDLIVFPELSLTGYLAEDLFLRQDFLTKAKDALKTYLTLAPPIYSIIGHPYQAEHHLFNACTLAYGNNILAQYQKRELPNNGVFDENRYFTPGNETLVYTIKDIPIGIIICEDLWRIEPTKLTANAGAKLIISPNASPFESDKHEKRMHLLQKRATQHHVDIIYCNQVAAQDDLLFDGDSLVMRSDGQLVQQGPLFEEALMIVDYDESSKLSTSHAIHSSDAYPKKIYDALVYGLKHYVNYSGFERCLLGLSGGIDSALTATIAVDALGKDAVEGILLPSAFTSTASIQDATLLAKQLGINTKTFSIDGIYNETLQTLSLQRKDQSVNITEQNIQARARAILLMALSNEHHQLLLSTGNRSELAVGYCTLYGDMAGAYAPLKDIPKTLVYTLAQYRNHIHPVIPEFTLTRAPSAELAPNQTDQDTLPPYDILDAILHHYIDEQLSVEAIIQQGFDAALVQKIIRMVQQNEYKRRQSVIGPHIFAHSFGRDWRYPMNLTFQPKK